MEQIRIDEYNYYSNIAFKLFEYMNGRINKMNICSFRIEMYDYNKNAYGNINYPNDIYINLGTIIDSWNYEWEDSIVTRHDYICTVISWTIAHELFHADQLISMVMYNNDSQYRLKVEGDVQRISYDWVTNNSRVLGEIGGFKCQIRYIKSENLPEVSDYRKASVKEYYLQIIANVIIRDLELFSKCSAFFDDSADSIKLMFNDTDSVYIKQDGKYLESNIGEFSKLAYKYSGIWNSYSLNMKAEVVSNKDYIIHIYCTDNRSKIMYFG